MNPATFAAALIVQFAEEVVPLNVTVSADPGALPPVSGDQFVPVFHWLSPLPLSQV